MIAKCRHCGSTEIDWITDPSDYLVGRIGGGEWYNKEDFKDLPNVEPTWGNFHTTEGTVSFSEDLCSHQYTGNPSCACGKILNPYVKDGNDKDRPYGVRGLSLEEASKTIREILVNTDTYLGNQSEVDVVKLMWDMQMISGKVYIERLREIGDKKQESCERLK